MEIKFYDLASIENDRLKYAIIISRYGDKWIFVREKGRDSWEFPAGHREIGEDINLTAARELEEETGALSYRLEPLVIYSVEDKGRVNFGQLFYARVETLGDLPDYEIEEIKFFDRMPDRLTYPVVQASLFKKLRDLEGAF